MSSLKLLSRTIAILIVIVDSQLFFSLALTGTPLRGARESALFFSGNGNHNINDFPFQSKAGGTHSISFRNHLLPVHRTNRAIQTASRRTTLVGTINGETEATASKGTNNVIPTLNKFLTNYFDRDQIKIYFTIISQSLKEGGGRSVGSRGERYILIQTALLFCFAINKVPLLDALINFILGPLVTLAGLVIATRSIMELGIVNWSPYILPNLGESNKSYVHFETSTIDMKTSLVTTGMYSQIRHPIYAGIITFCLGVSSWTKSTFRLWASLCLAYSLHLKSEAEEEYLKKRWRNDWTKYSKMVKGKFVPDDWIQRLPWLKLNSATSPV